MNTVRSRTDSAAFRLVEDKVRSLARADDGDLGVRLMRAAFHPGNGPLTDDGVGGSEREAMGALFAGAIRTFKNPISHCTVNYEDPILAAEAVLYADLPSDCSMEPQKRHAVGLISTAVRPK